MIVFDLACEGAGHVFEGWFGSTEDYEGQRARGLVVCPMCGDARVAKAVMAPRVAAKGNSIAAPPPRPTGDRPPAETMKALMRAMAETQRQALTGSDYVGNRFSDEARAMHEGTSEQRSIHGVATPEQARALMDDGIQVAPLPFPVRPPRTDH